MRSSYGGPGTSRSTWKPSQDPGKQAAAPPPANATAQKGGKNDGNRPSGNSASGQSTQQADEKKE